MQENIKPTPPLSVMKPGKLAWYTSLGLFGIILIITAFFWIFSSMRQWDIAAIETEIESINTDIPTISKDRKIVIANIVKNNSLRPSLNLFPVIEKFKEAAANANVRLNGFSIVNDVITTDLVATEGDSGVHPDPVATVIKMMREYATGKMDFSLEPISSISGDSTMRTTGIEFHVLPTNINK